MTGLNAAHHRVTNWTSPNLNTSTDYPDTLLNLVASNINGLSPVAGVERTMRATPLPALLRQQQYYTIHAGRAHFGPAGTPGADPKNLGFMVNIAGSEIGHPASYLGQENYDHPVKGKPNRNAVPGLEGYHGSEVFLTEALTREALKALDLPEQKKQRLTGRSILITLQYNPSHTVRLATTCIRLAAQAGLAHEKRLFFQ